jgi:predicted MFS family arabinose efflux permease
MKFRSLIQGLFDGLPGSFWAIWAGILLNRLGGVAYPFLSFFLVSRGFDSSFAALAVSFWGAGALCSSVLGGWSADTFGRRRTLLSSLGSASVVLLIIPRIAAPTLLLLFSFIGGLVFDLARPAVAAAVADLVPPQDRARAYGLNYWAVNIGFSFAPMIGGLLAARSYSYIFFVNAAAAAAYFLIIFFRLPETRPVSSTPRRILNPFSPLKDKRLFFLCILATLLTAQFFQAYSTLPLTMKLVGLGEESFGPTIAVNGITVVLLSIVLGKIVRRWRPQNALILAALLIGGGFAANQFAVRIEHFMIATAIWTLGEIIIASVMPALVANLAPPDRRGAYQGCYSMAWGTGAFLGPAIGGALLQACGNHALWTACGLAGIAAAAGFHFTKRATGAEESCPLRIHRVVKIEP